MNKKNPEYLLQVQQWPGHYLLPQINQEWVGSLNNWKHIKLVQPKSSLFIAIFQFKLKPGVLESQSISDGSGWKTYGWRNYQWLYKQEL